MLERDDFTAFGPKLLVAESKLRIREDVCIGKGHQCIDAAGKIGLRRIVHFKEGEDVLLLEAIGEQQSLYSGQEHIGAADDADAGSPRKRCQADERLAAGSHGRLDDLAGKSGQQLGDLLVMPGGRDDDIETPQQLLWVVVLGDAL